MDLNLKPQTDRGSAPSAPESEVTSDLQVYGNMLVISLKQNKFTLFLLTFEL